MLRLVHHSMTLCTLALSVFCVPAQAIEAPPYSILLKQSFAQAPALLEQAAQVRAAYADARQTHAWLNPTVDAFIENLNAPLSGGVSQRQDTYSVTQSIEMPGKRSARIQLGERNTILAEVRDKQAKVEFSSKLAMAYAMAEAMQAYTELAKEDIKHACEELKATQTLVQAGKESKQRIAQAQANVAVAQAAEQAASANQTEALEMLSAFAGAKESYTHVPASLLNQPNHLVFAEKNHHKSLAFLTAIAEQEALQASIKVEEKRRTPDISFNLGLRRFGWTNQNAFVMGVSTSLPLFDQNSGAIAASRERAIAAMDRQDAIQLEAAAARRIAIVQLAASEKRLEAALQGEQAATEAYRLAEIGYKAGKTSLIEVLMAHKTLFDSAKKLTIESRLARVRAIAALFQADGRIAFGDQ